MLVFIAYFLILCKYFMSCFFFGCRYFRVSQGKTKTYILFPPECSVDPYLFFSDWCYGPFWTNQPICPLWLPSSHGEFSENWVHLKISHVCFWDSRRNGVPPEVEAMVTGAQATVNVLTVFPGVRARQGQGSFAPFAQPAQNDFT